MKDSEVIDFTDKILFLISNGRALWMGCLECDAKDFYTVKQTFSLIQIKRIIKNQISKKSQF